MVGRLLGNDRALVVSPCYCGASVEFTATHLVKSPRRTLEEARELEITRLQAETNSAQASIAEANARTREAEVTVALLRQQASPRRLDRQAFAKELEGKPKPSGEQILYLEDIPDGFDFAMDLYDALKAAQWIVAFPSTIPDVRHPNDAAAVPRAMKLGGNPNGITVLGSKSSDLDRETSHFALLVALGRANVGQVAGSVGHFVPERMLWVVIAAKAQGIPAALIPAK
jgi:hypothetical protein